MRVDARQRAEALLVVTRVSVSVSVGTAQSLCLVPTANSSCTIVESRQQTEAVLMVACVSVS